MVGREEETTMHWTCISSAGVGGKKKRLKGGEKTVQGRRETVQEWEKAGSREKELSDDDNDIVMENASFVRNEPPQDDQGPPKVDSEVEILHEKVKKQIIKEGHGHKPAKLATCFLHYRAWVEHSSHKFEDTWQEQHPIELILGKGIVQDNGQIGERCTLPQMPLEKRNGRAGHWYRKHEEWGACTVACWLGIRLWGGRKLFLPKCPPMADLLYEVELIGFDDIKEGKARSDMTVEERIEAADRRKVEGNAHFKDEKLQEAMQQYEMAIAYMGDDFMFQLFGKYRDMALAVKNPCHLNMAACLIKLQRYDEAIGQCTIVLSEDENNVKALFRRGKARAALGQTEAAREDFQRARKYAPEDKAILKELRSLAEHDKAVYEKQKEIYKGIFGPRPEPKPKKSNLLVVFWHWLLSLIHRLFNLVRRKTD
uniref:peptidylprolyl isomerase n=1 Tax=Ananas comosus var. bracteatus TaxID=296719 RepID=A0A6V7NIL9_ANACO|nr:unnamed protein product [Ananas comosus var. bracteatus]